MAIGSATRSLLISSAASGEEIGLFLERGSVLLIVDVPFSRVDEIHELLQGKHPEAQWGGVDPTVPAFP